MEVENEAFQIRPMNCPFHCLVYKDALRSYRDLPFRWAELGTVYRCVGVLFCFVWGRGMIMYGSDARHRLPAAFGFGFGFGFGWGAWGD